VRRGVASGGPPPRTQKQDARTTIDIGGVLQTGRELKVHDSLALPDFASFRFTEPAGVSLVIRRIGQGLELRGTVEVIGEGECARCLDEVSYPLSLEIDENFEPAAELGDPLSESNVLSGDELDVRDLVRQLIDSALPYVILCREDCQGLCADCGLKRDGACRCPQPE
jgi:uncharacterized protein